ncbi:MAG TPA: hypothetical protein VFM97_02295 [Gammaproteobacteria bacterium]|nr:hypothetical protein [Gammaproteobacteria bacterium]
MTGGGIPKHRHAPYPYRDRQQRWPFQLRELDPSYLTPTAFQMPRYVRFSVEYDFL